MTRIFRNSSGAAPEWLRSHVYREGKRKGRGREGIAAARLLWLSLVEVVSSGSASLPDTQTLKRNTE